MQTYNPIIHFERDTTTNILSFQAETHICHIPLDKFEKWLIQTDRLNWVHDWSDECGQHCQETGTYTLDSYWQMAQTYIKSDIYDFLVHHKFISINKPIQSKYESRKTTDMVRNATTRTTSAIG